MVRSNSNIDERCIMGNPRRLIASLVLALAAAAISFEEVQAGNISGHVYVYTPYSIAIGRKVMVEAFCIKTGNFLTATASKGQTGAFSLSIDPADCPDECGIELKFTAHGTRTPEVIMYGLSPIWSTWVGVVGVPVPPRGNMMLGSPGCDGCWIGGASSQGLYGCWP
jgi:hypothetical protein